MSIESAASVDVTFAAMLDTFGDTEGLATTRHERGLTQAQLAEAVELHVAQIRRYEAGSAQPTLDRIRRLARALAASADLLVFDTDERRPAEDLALVFEAAGQLDDEGRALVKALVEGIVLRQQSRRFANAS